LKVRPSFSIITPVLNGGKHLEQAIRSVIGQAWENKEYIIIDGGSTDNSLDIIRKYESHIDFWKSERDEGIFDAMNKGIEKASGDFIGILNADDWYEPDILSQFGDRIGSQLKGQGNQVFFFDYYVIDEVLSKELKTEKKSSLKFMTGMSICHQAMFIHRSVYETVGRYNTSYSLAADYDLFLRMIEAGVDFHKVEVFGVNFRKGGQSTKYLKESVRQTGLIIKTHFGLLSRSYIVFVFSNRLPSLLGRLQLFLYRYAGSRLTNRLRRLRRRFRFSSSDVRK
jgi:glycosyltransferase involved in cell wall biosynthesis